MCSLSPQRILGPPYVSYFCQVSIGLVSRDIHGLGSRWPVYLVYSSITNRSDVARNIVMLKYYDSGGSVMLKYYSSNIELLLNYYWCVYLITLASQNVPRLGDVLLICFPLKLFFSDKCLKKRAFHGSTVKVFICFYYLLQMC